MSANLVERRGEKSESLGPTTAAKQPLGIRRLLAGLAEALSGSLSRPTIPGPMGPSPQSTRGVELRGGFSVRELERVTGRYKIADEALRSVARTPELMQALLELDASADFDPLLRKATADVSVTFDPETGEIAHHAVVFRTRGRSIDEEEAAIVRLIAAVGILLRRARLVIDIRPA